jgi:hypothetical protein
VAAVGRATTEEPMVLFGTSDAVVVLAVEDLLQSGVGVHRGRPSWLSL